MEGIWLVSTSVVGWTNYGLSNFFLSNLNAFINESNLSSSAAEAVYELSSLLLSSSSSLSFGTLLIIVELYKWMNKVPFLS